MQAENGTVIRPAVMRNNGIAEADPDADENGDYDMNTEELVQLLTANGYEATDAGREILAGSKTTPDIQVRLAPLHRHLLLSAFFPFPSPKPLGDEWIHLCKSIPADRVGSSVQADGFCIKYDVVKQGFYALQQIPSGISELPESMIVRVLHDFDHGVSSLNDKIGFMRGQRYQQAATEEMVSPSGHRIEQAAQLDTLGRDLIELAVAQNIKPEHVRMDLLNRVIKLASGLRPVVLLVGDHGTGKNALVYALAAAVATGSSSIQTAGLDCRPIYECTPESFSVSVFYAHEFETKISLVAKQCIESKAILFMDKIEGAATQGRVSEMWDRTLANILIPYLQRREITLIGATTPDGLKYMRNENPAFADMFNIVEVPEATIDQTLEIIGRRMEELGQQKPGLDFESGMAEAVVDVSYRFIKGRKFPGKALELLSELVDVAEELDGTQKVTRSDVVAAVVRKTGFRREFVDVGIPFTGEQARDSLEREVLDQEEAVRATAEVVTRIKSELVPKDRPLAAMMFCGPTGVGKTQLAKAVSHLLFGGEETFLRYDMSEYSGPDAVTKLCGSMGRYNDHAGRLIADMRSHPASVLLFDEIEKAHFSVFNLLLQIMDAARLTSPGGQTVSFDNAFIVLTSNIGSDLYASKIGLRDPEEGTVSAGSMLQAVEKWLSPEFVNRLSHVVVFQSLCRDTVSKIAIREVNNLAEMSGLSSRKLKVKVSRALLDVLVERGYERRYGARAMQRAVLSLVADPLGEIIAANPGISDRTLTVDWQDGPVCTMKKPMHK